MSTAFAKVKESESTILEWPVTGGRLRATKQGIEADVYGVTTLVVDLQQIFDTAAAVLKPAGGTAPQGPQTSKLLTKKEILRVLKKAYGVTISQNTIANRFEALGVKRVFVDGVVHYPDNQVSNLVNRRSVLRLKVKSPAPQTGPFTAKQVARQYKEAFNDTVSETTIRKWAGKAEVSAAKSGEAPRKWRFTAEDVHAMFDYKQKMELALNENRSKKQKEKYHSGALPIRKYNEARRKPRSVDQRELIHT